MNSNPSGFKPPLLKGLVTIVDASKVKMLTVLFKELGLPIHYQIRAEGTASNEMLDILGLAPTEKMLTYSLAPATSIATLINRINREGVLSQKGGGIAFTIALSGAGSSIFKLLEEEAPSLFQTESEVKKMNSDNTHELIVAAINHGFSEELMETAKEAGARGGTVIHARRIGADDSMKFMGISLQAEKEIITILTLKETKVTIMKAISEKFGLKTEARGLVFSMPVDTVAGLE